MKLVQIATHFKNFDIDLYYCGGCVRDKIIGNIPDDIDVCIVGGETAKNIQEHLENLKAYGTINTITSVHGSFPIWIVEIDGEKYEFAMARTERKTGLSHQEFECGINNVTIEQDLERRDFTINAIAENILTGQIIDPYEGQKHIKQKLLHPTSRAFVEDHLRVIRGARFAARFGFSPTEEFYSYAWNIIPTKDTISNERVGKELMKLFSLPEGVKCSEFFRVLRKCRWLGYYFQELEDLINIPQNPEHHPEIWAFEHTLYCIDQAKDWMIRSTMLCHDLGKATTTTTSLDGKIKSIGHEEESSRLGKQMLKRIHFCDHKTISQIGCLIELHMIRAQMASHNHEKLARRTLRKLMHYQLGYPDLVETVKCDLNGRPPKVFEEDPDIGQDIMFYLLINDKMTPIVTGEKLIKYGLVPSPEFGKIMSKALELQDRGTLDESNWIERLRGCGFKEFKNKLNE